jgi:hypothetical protein
MLEIRGHGGNCCGMWHLVNFNATTTQESILSYLRRIPKGRLIEVVLNQTQIELYPRVLEGLATYGFVLTTVFRNDNSRNVCYVFHRAENRLPLTHIGERWAGMYATPGLQENLPQMYNTLNTPGNQRHANPNFELPVPQSTPPFHIVSTFHNVYRNGRVGGGYDTVAAARAARRETGEIRCKKILWNGNEVVTEWQNIL